MNFIRKKNKNKRNGIMKTWHFTITALKNFVNFFFYNFLKTIVETLQSQVKIENTSEISIFFLKYKS